MGFTKVISGVGFLGFAGCLGCTGFLDFSVFLDFTGFLENWSAITFSSSMAAQYELAQVGKKINVPYLDLLAPPQVKIKSNKVLKVMYNFGFGQPIGSNLGHK